MDKTAVLLATYNGEKWLNEQVNSILNQSDISIDLHISDDISTDKTCEIISAYQNKFDNIFSLAYEAQSSSAAQNFFRLIRDVDLHNYSYIAFSDQDDVWVSNKLSLAIDAINRFKVDGYSSNVIAFWSNEKTLLINKAQSQTKYDYMFESAGPGCTFVITSRLATELQQFLRANTIACKNIALHDWFIYAFARSSGYKWYIDTRPGLMYRQHATNAFGANTEFKAIKARLNKLKQGWYTQQILLIAGVLNYQDVAPLKRLRRLSILDRIYLAFFAYQFRRRLRDRFAFAFFILFLARKS